MLNLELTKKPESLLEVFPVVPDRLVDQTLDEIAHTRIFYGNRPARLGEWFEISGDAADLRHRWQGDLSRVGGIGYRMSSGRIQVLGDAGNHLGARMLGGQIEVEGSAGDFVGAEMTGGRIHISGNAGNGTGAAYDPGQSGQNGGLILINGSAGNLTGYAMRRGVIAIGGDTGNCCGYGMKAGTIVVLGTAGKNIGLEMKRGTLVVMQPANMPVTGFVTAGIHPMPVTALLKQFLQDSGFPYALNADTFQVFHGDLLQGKRGELLLPA